MTFIHNKKKYSSKKHPILEHIFNKKNPEGNTSQKSITFTLKDISDGYTACNIDEPASISNTILDLTRKKRSISSRLPSSIYSLGYDLRKKTGTAPNGESYAGEFVFVGVGNEIQSWLSWPKVFPQGDMYTLSSNGIPQKIRKYLRNDEGALFSVIDYCDVLSQVLGKSNNSVIRIQNPLKWQPNEIDGFYFGEDGQKEILYPVEAKALTTGDDINLEQMTGGLLTMCSKYKNNNVIIQPLAVKMVKNGIFVSIFNRINSNSISVSLTCQRKVFVKFNPVINSWK